MVKYAANSMWEEITSELKSNIERFDVSDFKSSKINNRISLYNCETHGYFFFKTLIYLFCKVFTDDQLKRLNKVKNRNLGKPVTINFNGDEICMDYLQSLSEVIFLESCLENIKSVMEIGAGYGRTCHTVLSLFSNIEKYIIIDLPEIIEISKKYLASTLDPVDFSKIIFIENNQIPKDLRSDLAINIDSMQEMSADVAKEYLHLINASSNCFYSKNTLGKFSPEILNIQQTEKTKSALDSGLITNIFNIFSPAELEKQYIKFIEVFSPAPNWAISKSAPVFPWSHYYQALYTKKNS
jgi:hypothetical protein